VQQQLSDTSTTPHALNAEQFHCASLLASEMEINGVQASDDIKQQMQQTHQTIAELISEFVANTHDGSVVELPSKVVLDQQARKRYESMAGRSIHRRCIANCKLGAYANMTRHTVQDCAMIYPIMQKTQYVAKLESQTARRLLWNADAPILAKQRQVCTLVILGRNHARTCYHICGRPLTHSNVRFALQIVLDLVRARNRLASLVGKSSFIETQLNHGSTLSHEPQITALLASLAQSIQPKVDSELHRCTKQLAHDTEASDSGLHFSDFIYLEQQHQQSRDTRRVDEACRHRSTMYTTNTLCTTVLINACVCGTRVVLFSGFVHRWPATRGTHVVRHSTATGACIAQ
jgi:Zn-dependent oligopeptidase